MKAPIAPLRTDARVSRITAPGVTAATVTDEGEAWLCRMPSWTARVSFEGDELARGHLPANAWRAGCTRDGTLVALCASRNDAWGVRMRESLLARVAPDGRERSRVSVGSHSFIANLCVGDDDRAYVSGPSAYECTANSATIIAPIYNQRIALERTTNELYCGNGFEIGRVRDQAPAARAGRTTPPIKLQAWLKDMAHVQFAPCADGTLWIASKYNRTNGTHTSLLRRVLFERPATATPTALCAMDIDEVFAQLIAAKDGGVWGLTTGAVLIRFDRQGVEQARVRVIEAPRAHDEWSAELSSVQLCRNERFLCGLARSSRDVVLLDLRSVGLA